MGNFPEPLNLNRLFLKLNWFICGWVIFLNSQNSTSDWSNLTGSSVTGNFPEVLIYNRLSLKLNQFICMGTLCEPLNLNRFICDG